MTPSSSPFPPHQSQPIRIGLTCWRWQSRKAKAIVQLANKAGVTVELTETMRGLHREIEAQVSGANIDRFLGEFARHF